MNLQQTKLPASLLIIIGCCQNSWRNLSR